MGLFFMPFLVLEPFVMRLLAFLDPQGPQRQGGGILVSLISEYGSFFLDGAWFLYLDRCSSLGFGSRIGIQECGLVFDDLVPGIWEIWGNILDVCIATLGRSMSLRRLTLAPWASWPLGPSITVESGGDGAPPMLQTLPAFPCIF